MKLMITGGAGFIGSHLCDKYVHEGHTVLCLDNFINGNLMNIRHLLSSRNFKLINGDIRDFDLIEKITRDVDAIFHLAAQIHVDRSIIEPGLTYGINVLGTQNILEVARMSDVDKIIYASTSEVYGSAQYSPMDEKHPLGAPHPYGASKIAADRMCHAYIQTYGMNICIMRPFNIFGPRQKDSGYGGAISLFSKRVLSNMPPIIYGDGQQTRDYTYVEDVVDAYDLILNYKKSLAEPINFGTGVDIKIIDLANLIIRLLKKEGTLKPVHIEERPGEVRRLIADISRAKAIGWQPKYGIEDGLRKYIDWYKNYRFEEWAKPG
jgi:UDP-glucose 4-epimerase